MLDLRTPGVYIQEIPSGVRTIAAVSTSNTALVGYFVQGPVNRAVRISSYGDFERSFGGLDADSQASYAIQQYYLNGGSVAYVVRVHSNAVQASRSLDDATGTQVFTLRAENPGLWGMGIIFFIIGIANKDKWGQETKWSDLPPGAKRTKLIFLGGMTLILLVALAFYIFSKST